MVGQTTADRNKSQILCFALAPAHGCGRSCGGFSDVCKFGDHRNSRRSVVINILPVTTGEQADVRVVRVRVDSNAAATD